MKVWEKSRATSTNAFASFGSQGVKSPIQLPLNSGQDAGWAIVSNNGVTLLSIVAVINAFFVKSELKTQSLSLGTTQYERMYH
jgi:hypothetical protein